MGRVEINIGSDGEIMQKQREDMQKLADSLDECFEDSDKRFIEAPYNVADKS